MKTMTTQTERITQLYDALNRITRAYLVMRIDPPQPGNSDYGAVTQAQEALAALQEQAPAREGEAVNAGSVIELAKVHGVRYVNRHYPEKSTYGFTSEGLIAFANAVAAPQPAQPEQRGLEASKAKLLTSLTQWLDDLGGEIHTYSLRGIALHGFEKGWDAALKSAQPVAPPLPLTDERIYEITGTQQRDAMMRSMAVNIARWVEAEHGIKA